MGKLTARRSLVVVAALGLACLSPGVALAAGADGPDAKGHTKAYVPNSEHSVGHATFDDHGERLFACDDSADTYTTTAKLKWKKETYSVSDSNGAGGGCEEAKNIPNIPEGDTVKVGVCVETYGCSDWVKTTA